MADRYMARGQCRLARFALCTARPAHRDNLLSEARAEEWLLAEWPEGETEPTKYWFSNLPEDIAFDRLIDLTKLRWRIERDYQELKQELGLGDYEDWHDGAPSSGDGLATVQITGGEHGGRARRGAINVDDGQRSLA